MATTTAPIFVKIAFLLSLMTLTTDAQLDFATRAMSVDLPSGFRLDLGDGTDFEFSIDAKVYKPDSSKRITESNAWQVSAWFGASADGGGDRVGYVDQTLNGEQSSTAFAKREGRLRISGVPFSLAPTARLCRDLTHFCIQLGATAEASGTVNVAGHPDDSVLTQCESVRCTENPNICESDENIYNVGDQWDPSDCESCTCLGGGTVDCETQECDIRCTTGDPIYTPGECCPTCPAPTSCEVEGRSYDIGAKWRLDVCTGCICGETGEVICLTEDCLLPVCPGSQAPIRRPGDCCFVCPLECLSSNEVYFHLEEWRPEVCTTCTCYDGSTECVTETCPRLDCDVGDQIRAANRCCAECAFDCDVSFDTTIPHDESWKPDVCTTCQCYNGTYDCFIEICEPPLCPPVSTVLRPGVCCKVCGEECVKEGLRYNHLAEWSPDPCTDCSCLDGTTDCREIRCLQPSCRYDQREITPEGQCCPVCSEDPPHVLQVDMVKIKFANPTLKLKKKSAQLKLVPIVTFKNDNREVRGSNLWKVSAWLSDDEDGVNEIGFVEQILSPVEAEKPFEAYTRLNLGQTKVRFTAKKLKCERVPYVCLRFDLTDNPLADGVSLFLHPSSVMQACEPIPECRNPK